MNRFRLRWGLIVAIGLFGVAGCGGCGGEQGGSSGNNRFLKLGTAPIGGAFYVVGGALAEVANEFKPEGLGRVSAIATKGSQQNIRDLDNGLLDFALSNSAITYFAVRGQKDWNKQYEMRAVMTLAPNIAMFITTENSGIKSIADLKDKRVSVGPAGAGFDHFVQPLLEAHGVKFEDERTADFTPLNATQTDAVDQLSDGSADAAFLGGAVPTSSIVQACSSLDIHFIPFEPDVRLKLIEEYPFFEPATIPTGVYSDLDHEFEGLNVGSMHLITTASQDAELVYEFTKTIYEHREAVVAKHPAGKAINPKVVVKYTGTEFHPGAIRYFEEIGIWPSDEEAPAADETEPEATGAN